MPRIHDELDPGHLVVLDREQEGRSNLMSYSPDRAGLALDEGGQCRLRTTLEGVCDPRRTPDFGSEAGRAALRRSP